MCPGLTSAAKISTKKEGSFNHITQLKLYDREESDYVVPMGSYQLLGSAMSSIAWACFLPSNHEDPGGARVHRPFSNLDAPNV